MTPAERAAAVQRYAERLAERGPTVEALGWRNAAQQRLRFDVLASMGISAGSSVLDVGCGFADFRQYLSDRQVNVRYTGCDISPQVLAIARTRHPDASLDERDILDEPYPDQSFDYVVISGIFNHRISDNRGFVERTLAAAFRCCRVAIAANMTTDQVDYQDPHLHYFNPEEVLRYCRTLSRHVALRHDYPLYEFTAFVRRIARQG